MFSDWTETSQTEWICVVREDFFLLLDLHLVSEQEGTLTIFGQRLQATDSTGSQSLCHDVGIKSIQRANPHVFSRSPPEWNNCSGRRDFHLSPWDPAGSIKVPRLSSESSGPVHRGRVLCSGDFGWIITLIYLHSVSVSAIKPFKTVLIRPLDELQTAVNELPDG